MVGFAAIADVLLVSTRLAGRGPALVAVPTDAAGLTARRLDALGGDPCFEVTLDGVRVAHDDVVASGSLAEALLERAMTASRVLDCAGAVGLSEGALALGVAHAKDRAQFGRPIGAFQAVANRLVDVRSDVDALRLLTHRAAWALGRAEKGSGMHTATMAGYAGWTAATASAATHQVMGAIGFTMEHDLQLFTRRLKAFETRVGPPAAHLETVATGLGLACE
jgi:alkylation response protein AidB-like acyl-CoA dehydrogenase